MFKYTTPEKKGIRSENIEKYIRLLESRRLSTHDIIIMRGDEKNVVFLYNKFLFLMKIGRISFYTKGECVVISWTSVGGTFFPTQRKGGINFDII